MRLLITLLIVVVIYTLQYELYKRYWDADLSVKLSFSGEVVQCDEKVELVEIIENDKPLALPILNVKFATSRSFLFSEEHNANISDMYYRNDIFSVLGNQRIERRLLFTTTERGIFRIRELQISSKDLFLKHNFAHIAGNDTEITVLPRRIPMQDYIRIRERIMGDYEINRWNNPDPFAFRGIRPYQSFDTMNSINWKASARMNELMVNQFQTTTENELRIYLNLRPYMKSQAVELAEHAISIVSTIAADHISHGINVSLYTNGWDIDCDDEEALPHITPGHGMEHLKALDILLARLDISKKTADMIKVLDEGFNSAHDNTTHVLVSTYRDDALYDFFKQHMNRKSVYWIIPEKSSNEVRLMYPGIYRWDM